MKFVFLFVLVISPVIAQAQSDSAELDALKAELEAIRAINEEYRARMEMLEKRLQAIETSQSAATSSVQSEPKILTEEELGEGAGFSTDFLPSRFDYFGYLRAGYGVTDEGTKQEKFRAPGSGAAYRLGNEVDTYMEIGFSYFHLDREKGSDAPVFGTHFMLAASSIEKNTSISLNDEDGAISLRQAYATASNVLDGQPEATFWAGQRYYRREDVHINDFFWMDMSGYGGGLDNYNLGFAKMSIAWIGGTVDAFSGRNDYIGDLENTDKNNLDFRLSDMDMGIGRGNLWLNYSKYRLAAENLDLQDAKGYSGGFWLQSPLGEDSSNLAVIQYGTGVAANFNSFSPSLRTGIDGDFPIGTRPEDQRRLRLMDVINHRFNDKLSMQAVAIYQKDDLGRQFNTDMAWYSLGIRPVYSITDLFNIAFEAGYDYTELENGDEGGLLKLSLASELTPSADFFSRPAIRFYLTYAKWSDEFRGLIGGSTLEDQTSGFAAGVQVESWW